MSEYNFSSNIIVSVEVGSNEVQHFAAELFTFTPHIFYFFTQIPVLPTPYIFRLVTFGFGYYFWSVQAFKYQTNLSLNRDTSKAVLFVY